MEYYKVQTIADYVKYRLDQGISWKNQIRFKTPVTLKHQGIYQETLTLETMLPAVFRRIYILDCFEDMDCEELYWQGAYPEVLKGNFRRIIVYRYSNTKDQRIALHDVKGDLQLSDIPQDLLPVLLAGEVTHIGKNTSFGFGRYRVQ